MASSFRHEKPAVSYPCHPCNPWLYNFVLSQNSQSRVRDLLDKSRAGTLNQDEESALNAVESLNHPFALIKARAWKHLPSAS
jgi:hypothetical protein